MIEALLPLLLPVLAAALVAQASPGPATLAIARESMAHGRRAGVALALGVSTGSWAWSAVAAGGMSALILASEWAVIGLRVAAALYLGWLAWKSARSALRPAASGGLGRPPAAGSSYARGLLIHLTNPKAILFFGALYAFGLPADASAATILLVAAAIAVQSLLIFTGMALLFSHAWIAAGYARLRRTFEAVFAFVFGSAAIGFLLAAVRPLLASLRKVPA
jgi:threonine/homoserine/homoserine lactone efflux protein